MDMAGTTVSAYNDLFDNEVYVECGRCGRTQGTGTSGPTLAQLVETAEHDCPHAIDHSVDGMEAPEDTVAVWESEGYRPAYVVNDGSGSYGPEDGA